MVTTPTSTEATGFQSRELFIALSVRAGEVFGNHEKALEWLQTPNPSLQGRSPLEAASTEDGFEQANDVLTRIEHGVLG